MNIANEEIRIIALKKNMKQWQIAEALNISEATLSRKLRHELSAEEKENVLRAIEQYEGAVNG